MRIPVPSFPASLVPGLVALALVAYATPPAAGTPEDDTCGAAALQGLLGETEAALAPMDLPADTLRLIRPGTAVTQDYRAERLNIVLDADGRIVRVYCG